MARRAVILAVPRDKHKKVRAILTEKRDELAEVLRRRESIVIERSPEATDEIQYAAVRELAIQNLDRESNHLRQVEAALERLENGSFGSCLLCDEAISANRLAAVPWSEHCIRCQESSDRAQIEPVSEAFSFSS